MKKLTSVLLALALLLLAGCGSATPASSAGTGTSSAASGKKQEINLFIWTEYMPQEVLDNFEAETGIHVNMKTFSSLADMYAMVKSAAPGTYDVIDVAGFYAKTMADEGLISKLDQAQIPNMSNLFEAYMKRTEDPGNVYTIPYQGAGTFICVNPALYSKPISSYEDLFDPALANSMVVINDFRAIIGTINLMLGFDFSETDPAKLEQTKEKLLSLKPNIKLLDSDSPKSAMLSGETSVGLIYNGEIAIAHEENPEIQIIYPAEGQYFGFDSLAITEASQNKEAAHKFLNYVLDAQTSKIISENFPYLNPNQAALELMDEEYKNNGTKNIPPEVIAKGYSPEDLDAATLDIYNDIWTEFTK
ncbi:spermidine/putrescine ABC transporter substrate-binding protein [Oscillospiraceae bacterium MB08-C2-2]|nr:spermidine/putrescine ABC transporter substrate-binding protein [Oscillospiraceae bacterium MB08-C2-2]